MQLGKFLVVWPLYASTEDFKPDNYRFSALIQGIALIV